MINFGYLNKARNHTAQFFSNPKVKKPVVYIGAACAGLVAGLAIFHFSSSNVTSRKNESIPNEVSQFESAKEELSSLFENVLERCNSFLNKYRECLKGYEEFNSPIVAQDVCARKFHSSPNISEEFDQASKCLKTNQQFKVWQTAIQFFNANTTEQLKVAYTGAITWFNRTEENLPSIVGEIFHNLTQINQKYNGWLGQ